MVRTTAGVALLATTSGVLIALAIPPSPSPVLGLVALAPLFLALGGCDSPGRATLLGALTGAVATGLSFRFLVAPMMSAGGLSPASAALAYAALTLWHAVPFAIAAFVGALAARRGGSASLLTATAIVALERLFPVPIPWCFGASLIDAPALVQSAAWLGPAGPTLTAVLASVASAELLRAAAGVAPDRRALTIGAALFAGSAFGGWFALGRARQSADAAPTFRVGLIQQGTDERLLEPLVTTSRELALEGAELVVWSEGAFPGVLPEGDAASAIGEVLEGRTGGASTLVGAVTRDPNGLRNAAILLAPDGTELGRHDKGQLLPFAERLPLERELPWLRALSPRSGRFVAGTDTGKLQVGRAVLAPSICYEDLFASRAHTVGDAPSANLLVNLTNDAWFAGSQARGTHFALARMRAVESGRTLIRASRDGVTAAVAPSGEVMVELPLDHGSELLVDVPLMDGTTLFSRFGALPGALLLALLGLASAVGRRARLSPSAPS